MRVKIAILLVFAIIMVLSLAGCSAYEALTDIAVDKVCNVDDPLESNLLGSLCWVGMYLCCSWAPCLILIFLIITWFWGNLRA
jgi:hypothetical protein